RKSVVSISSGAGASSVNDNALSEQPASTAAGTSEGRIRDRWVRNGNLLACRIALRRGRSRACASVKRDDRTVRTREAVRVAGRHPRGCVLHRDLYCSACNELRRPGGTRPDSAL